MTVTTELQTFHLIMQVVITLTFSLVALMLHTSAAAVQLRVGLYNEIPDLGNDKLASYKAMVEKGYNNEDHAVDAIVDSAMYNPYGDLEKYIADCDFDLLEIDTLSLPELVNRDLLTPYPLATVGQNVFPAALDAGSINGILYAYPTLLCGNFLIGLTPGNSENCNIKISRDSYSFFYGTLNYCNKNLLSSHPQYQRLLGGKMNDVYGYYLPYLYIDGYIDMYGSGTANEAVSNVLDGNVDKLLCHKLSWYIAECYNENGPYFQNKCYEDFPGSYVESSSNVYADIYNKETMFYFGFSENLAIIKQQNPSIVPYAAVSGPLGETNYLLQFTDALVISKKSWTNANEDKKNAIKEFVNYFVGLELRIKITLGLDLSPTQKRYLLQANREVYDFVNDPIYQDLFWSLERGVAAPALNGDQRKTMENVLSEKCVQL